MKRSILLVTIILAVAICQPAHAFRCWSYFRELLSSPPFPAEVQKRAELYPESVFKESSVKNVLFLADGSDVGLGMTAAEKIAKRFPGLQVTKTDLAIQKNNIKDNLTTLRMDNSKPFPDAFKGKFDLIVMDGGMCFHMGGVSCGGIPAEKGAALAFFSRVYQSLNSQNPGSKAFLGATDGRITSGQLRVLAEAGHELETQTGGAARVRVVMGTNGKFLGIEVTPK